MGIREDHDTLAEVAERLGDAGVSRVEWGDDGSPRVLEFHPKSDTIPCPPPDVDEDGDTVVSSRLGVANGVPVDLAHDDPHPDLVPDSEPPDTKVGRELEQLCAGARVESTVGQAHRGWASKPFPVLRRKFR